MHRVKYPHRARAAAVGLGVALIAVISAGTIGISCVFSSRTTFCEQFGLHCEEGQECAAEQAVCIPIGGCGDGVVDKTKGEVCDDGNIEDGQVVNGKMVLDSCSHDCMSTQVCGNGIPDMGEACDDGEHNGVGDDPCTADCTLRDHVCGNGIVEMDNHEACDPGTKDSAGCNSPLAGPAAECQFSTCGDGYANAAAGEDCDDGMNPSPTCNSPTFCKKSVCGDNFHNQAAGEDCDNGSADSASCNGNNGGQSNPASCKVPRCGDGYLNRAAIPTGSHFPETCDTGGDVPDCNGAVDSVGGRSNNPDAMCQVPSCGDGYANPMATPDGSHFTETCDTGGDSASCNGGNGNTDAQSNNADAKCQPAQCGDGYLNKSATPTGSTRTEACDTGGDSSGCNGGNDKTGNHSNNANAKCQPAQCGDGYLNTNATPKDSSKTEACDTGGDTSTCNGGNDTTGTQTNNADAKCQPAQCGDGYLNTNATPGGSSKKEACDTGGDTSTCNGGNDTTGTQSNDPDAKCQAPRCGDGYTNPNFKPSNATADQTGEQCDDGNANSDTKVDACRTNCHKASCGDGVLDTGEQCDPPHDPCGAIGKRCNPLSCECVDNN